MVEVGRPTTPVAGTPTPPSSGGAAPTGTLGTHRVEQVSSGASSTPAVASRAVAVAAAHVEGGPPRAPLSGGLRQVLGDMRDRGSGDTPILQQRGSRTPALHERRPELMKSTDLIKEVGRKPQEDRLFGLYKMSSHYKAVIGDLDAYHKMLERPVGEGPGGAQAQAMERVDQLMKVIKSADAYIAKHPGDATAVAAMNKLKEQAASEIADVNAVAQFASKNPADAAGMSWKDAVVGGHYRLLGSVAKYNDSNIDPGNPPTRLSGGAVSEVWKITYAVDDRLVGRGGELAPREAETRVTAFKPEPAQHPEGSAPPVTLGIHTDPPSYGARNVATRFVSEALGLNTAPPCTFALHGGQIGYASDFAPGKPGQGPQEFPVTRPRDIREAERALKDDPSGEGLQELGYRKGDPTKGDTAAWYRTDPLSVDMGKYTAGMAEPLKSRAEANLKRELVNLQVMDLICGQIDRHAGNYLVDVDRATGGVRVTGIDNDFSFGRAPIDMTAGVDKLPPLPPVMDRQLADRLVSMDFDRDVAPTLSTLLTSAERQAAKERFSVVQAHAANLIDEGMAVDDWVAWRGPDGLTAGQVLESAPADRPTSYWAREVATAAEQVANRAKD